MATTTNFGWETPDDTDLVKDGAAAMRTLGNAIDTSLVDLKGGTTGQILSKASNTDLDYTWINNDQGDITAVTAGTGISGGGTSGAVTITNDMATTITAKGDIVAGTGNATYDNLAVGTNGQVLTADSTAATGLKWAASTAFGTLTAYTPTWTGVTQGNGTFSNVGYCESGDLVWYYGLFTCGSTTSFTGLVSLSLPVNAKPDGGNIVIRQGATNMAAISDASTGYLYPLITGVQNANPSTRLTFWTSLTSSTYLQNQAQELQNTAPITPAVNDEIFWNVIYRKA